MEFCEKKWTKPPVARKLAVRHTKLVCLTASFLATDGFKFELFQNACMVYKHAYLNTLLLLHSAFMLRVVKMPLNREVGGHALNSHGNYIVDHGKSWNCVFEFLWEPWRGYYCSLRRVEGVPLSISLNSQYYDLGC